MRIIRIIVFSVIAIVFVVFISFWISYSIDLKKQEDLWFEEEYKPLRIKGVITNITSGEYPSDFYTIFIKNYDDKTYSYGLCIKSESEFINFIQIGDSAIKNKGEIKFVFIKKEDRCSKEFELPFCKSFFFW